MQRRLSIPTILIVSFLSACSDNSGSGPAVMPVDKALQKSLEDAAFEDWDNLEDRESPVVQSMDLRKSAYSARAPVPTPRSMVSFGDSITKAAMATLSRSKAHKWWVQIQLPFIALKAIVLRSQAANFPSVSWSGGLGVKRSRRVYRGGHWVTVSERTYPVRSHAFRLQQQSSHSLKVCNVGESGAKGNDLHKQLERMERFSKRELDGKMPDYATLMIGGNDICKKRREGWEDKMTPVDELYAQVEEVVERVLGGSEHSRMLIAALPQIENLQAVAQESQLRLISKFTAAIIPGLHPVRRCRDLWEGLGKPLCDNLFNEEDPVKRALMRQRVNEYNEAFVDLVSKKREIYGDRIRFAWGSFDNEFNDDDLALDCFHPNVNGQNKLAEATWQDSWW